MARDTQLLVVFLHTLLILLMMSHGPHLPKFTLRLSNFDVSPCSFFVFVFSHGEAQLVAGRGKDGVVSKGCL